MKDPIFILASGQRCGSTLIQRLLNSHDDIMIWGEQHGALNHFFRLHKVLLEWESDYKAHRETFFEQGYDNFTPNMIPSDKEIIAAARDYVYSLFAKPTNSIGKNVWGFKEVRYDSEVAAFLLRLFPDSKIIWLTRNILDCILSLKHWENDKGPWTRQWTETFVADWKRVNESFLLRSNSISNYIMVKYEDLVSDKETEVERICDLIDIHPCELNLDVFSRKIHNDGKNGMVARKILTSEDLTKEDRKLISNPSIANINALLGYNYSLG